MLKVFKNDVMDAEKFIVTLELIPGRESGRPAVDVVKGIARDSFADGRISAVSITDNPGGNPALSPDVIGYDIFKVGMDVIVHFTCRDMNRVGMESRALQLAMMGMKNILALTGDYTGQGFGGRGLPVFDLDSVNLLIMLNLLNERITAGGDPDGFFTGCAVSPFKQAESETYNQYAKLYKKVSAGAQFIITQLGYDVAKFKELGQLKQHTGIYAPTLGTVYLLTPKVARLMNQKRIPGAVVTDKLLEQLTREWRDPRQGRKLALERAAKLGVILKGLGFKGVHLGGVHKNFDTAGKIMDLMETLQDNWRDYIREFDFPQPNGFYVFANNGESPPQVQFGRQYTAPSTLEKVKYRVLSFLHGVFFDFKSPTAELWQKLCRGIARRRWEYIFMELVEDPVKKILLDCQECGDCAIAYVAFLCPESQCPKHIRNGACGGSHNGYCEVRPERKCVWVRAYRRLAVFGHADKLLLECAPPRMWELNQTSSWINFHLARDHQSVHTAITQFCKARTCKLPIDIGDGKNSD